MGYILGILDDPSIKLPPYTHTKTGRRVEFMYVGAHMFTERQSSDSPVADASWSPNMVSAVTCTQVGPKLVASIS